MTEKQICIVVVLLAIARPCLGGDSEALAKLCAANTAAVESIHTLHCKVTYTNAQWDIPSGEYWRSGNMERVYFVHKGHENRGVVRDGLVKYTVRQDISDSPNMKGSKEVQESLEGGRYYWHGALERHDGQSRFLFEPWLSARCSMSDGGKSGNVSYAQFFTNHKSRLESVKSVKFGASTKSVVEVRFPTATCRYYFDPRANYMACGSEYISDNADGDRSLVGILSHKEYAPGVFFPEKVVIKR